jgi:hypothetical protein
LDTTSMDEEAAWRAWTEARAQINPFSKL